MKVVLLRAHPCVAPSQLTPVPPDRLDSSTSPQPWRHLHRQRMAPVAVDSSSNRMTMRSIGSEVSITGEVMVMTIVLIRVRPFLEEELAGQKKIRT